jgi:hypothetical protein
MKILSFTGGIGAQIISAAGYFYLQKNNPETTFAYLDYFLQPPHLATPGISREISHWQWELSSFGLDINDFKKSNLNIGSNVIWDGLEKLNYGFTGLRDPVIASKFPIDSSALNYRYELFGNETYTCIHLRRGDYLNVASYIVSDEAFLRAIYTVSKITSNLLVVSDSPLSSKMQTALTTLNIKCVLAVGGTPYLTHCLMRLSDILICSNSQYSLTAAALRDEYKLSIYPSLHDANLDSYSNIFLNKIREFQIITGF